MRKIAIFDTIVENKTPFRNEPGTGEYRKEVLFETRVSNKAFYHECEKKETSR